MKLIGILLFAIQVSFTKAQSLGDHETVQIKDVLLGKTLKSSRYVGRRPVEKYNHYNFQSASSLFKQLVEEGRRIANAKFTWSLTRDPDRNMNYLTITDHLSKKVVIYWLDEQNSMIEASRLLFLRNLDDSFREELYLRND